MLRKLRQRTRTGFYSARGDAELLRYIAGFHYLQVKHLTILTGRSLRTLQRRLLQLHRQGRLLDRLTLPADRDWLLANPNSDGFVYRLAPKGADRAKRFGFIDDGFNYNSEKRTSTLTHDLGLTVFHLLLELASRQGCWRLASWEQRRAELLDWALDAHGQRLPVNPDALFGLVNPTLPGEAIVRFYFLEFERVRQHNYADGVSALIRKCEAFEQYARQGRHQQTWGFPDFRLLVIMPTPARVENLLLKLEQSGLALRRFWLTDLGRLSLEDPTTISGKIFRTPRDYRTGALYSLAGE